MRRAPIRAVMCAGVLLALVPLALFITRPAGAQTQAPAGQQMRFAADIQAFLDQDRAAAPPQQAILFVGSSIFRQWTNVQEQMAPLPVFNRAFGGARTWEVLHYMDQIVLPYRPRIIVYYTGSNDVSAGEPAAAITGRVMEFVDKVHRALPETLVYFVAINRSPEKRARWSIVDRVNADMEAQAMATPHLGYIDLNPALFGSDGEPRLELYRPDQLHFLPPAYDLFAGIIKPVLIDAWRQVASSADLSHTGRHAAPAFGR